MTDPAALCLACNFCCDGTLFDFAEVPEGESLHPALRQGAKGGKPGFHQPCPCSDTTGCLIYASRPGVCRDFRCVTLDAFAQSRITFSDALKRVEGLRRLANEARALAGGESIADCARALQGLSPEQAAAPEGRRLALVLAAIQRSTSLHFGAAAADTSPARHTTQR